MIERQDPKRLLDGGASDLERSLIGAIAGEQPSPELRDRMAQALGVPLAAAGLAATVAASQAAATAKTAAGIGAGAGVTAPLAWISVGVVSLVLAGAIVGVGVWRNAPAKSLPAPVISPATLPVLPPAQPELGLSPVVEMPLNGSAPLAQPRSRSVATARDLRKQIAIIDAARAAISASAGERALDLLRQYQEKYQGGTFAPEAAALKIEALAKLGRAAEARAGAERFRAQYGESPQTDRVLRAAGLAAP
jgi:hypothetical protein